MSLERIDEVLEFWIGTVGPEGWYLADPAVDRIIAARFAGLVEQAIAGALQAPEADWSATAEGSLALLILLDQFPRNLYRDDPRAFAGDDRAREAATRAIDRGFDLATREPERQFFYLPFEHSEALEDQDRAVALCAERLRSEPKALLHAEKHRELIHRFGRFPHRNALLGRTNSAEEQAHLDGGGYAPGAAPKKSS